MVVVREELDEASLAVYLRACPNCGGAISDKRLLAGLPCVRCLPSSEVIADRESLFRAMRERGTIKLYGELEEVERVYGELLDLFRRAVGSEPWGVQKLWLKRLSKGISFAMLAPTGVGKTTAGLLAAIYFAMKGRKSYVIVPTTILVDQAERIVRRFLDRLGLTALVVSIHSRLSKSERLKREEAVQKWDFDILITTSRYLMKNFDKIKMKNSDEQESRRFGYVFVDDVDAIMRGSRAIELILQLMGFSEEDIAAGMELIKLRREVAYRGPREDVEKELAERESLLRERARRVKSVLVISSATGSPRGIRSRLFRELLGFDIGARPELIRNVVDAYILPSKSLEETAAELVKSLGKGGLVYVPTDRGIEYANHLAEHLRASGVRAEALHSKKTGTLQLFVSGEVDVLVGVATYYGVLVRGIDLPEHVRYAVFVGVPRHKVALRVERLDAADVLRLLPILISSVESDEVREKLERCYARLARTVRRAGAFAIERFREVMRRAREPETSVERVFVEALKLVEDLIKDPRVLDSIVRNPEVAVVSENGERYVLIPDAPTYIQASGRTSRLYLGGISRGISITIVDDKRLLRGLERRLSFVMDDFKFVKYSEIHPEEIMKEVDGDRELIRRIREGTVPEEELKKLRGLEFKTSLLVVESPNKARTMARFFGRPSTRVYGRLRVYEVSLGNQTLLVTSSGGHVYDLITDLAEPTHFSEWRILFGVAIKSGNPRPLKYVPIYAPIKRCQSCGRQFTNEPAEDACPYCGSKRVVNSWDFVSAIRDVAMEVDEVLVGTDPDTEGEKIAYDLVSLVAPMNGNIRRIEFHEVTRRALLNAIANPRDVDTKLVKAQLVRRIEDRWIGFSLSRELQGNFWIGFCREVTQQRYRSLCEKNPRVYRNLSAGRVQTPVLGWVIDAEKRYRATRRRVLVATVEGLGDVEFTYELPKEYDRKIRRATSIASVEVIVEVPRRGELRKLLKAPPPFTTDSALSELCSRYRMPAARVMEILQDLFEVGLITYHRTDSTRVSDAGIRVAEDYLRQVEGRGYKKIFRPRRWGEGGAHEAIRPTRPIDAETLRRLVEEGVIEPVIRLRREHYMVYDAIFRRFIASQSARAKVVVSRFKYRMVMRLKKGREIVAKPRKYLEIYTSVVKEGFLKYDRTIRVRKPIAPGTYLASSFSLLSRSRHLPHTEASLVREMKRAGIGRPSTYSKIVETILRRGYALKIGSAGFMDPTLLGERVYDYLVKRFGNLVSEERTRDLERRMDMVERGQEDYEEVLSILYSDLENMGLV